MWWTATLPNLKKRLSLQAYLKKSGVGLPPTKPASADTMEAFAKAMAARGFGTFKPGPAKTPTTP